MNHIDIFHDPGHARLHALLDTYPKLAAYLGAEKVAAEDDPGALPDRAFADPIRRFFPLHTAKHAALSEAYYRAAVADGVQVPPEVAFNLKEARMAYELNALDLYEAAPTAEKTAAAEDCLFPEQRLYPIRDAEEVKTAEERLLAERTKLQPVNRVAAFGRLFKKATQLGVALSPTSYKYAGLTETDAGKLRDLLRARAAATSDDGVKTAFHKLADVVHANPRALRSRETQIKLADAVTELDARGDLVKHYDRALPDPLETVFNTEKVAYSGVELGGENVPMTKLMSLDPSFYADALGDDFLPDITTGGQLDSAKVAEVLPTLPRDMKIALRRALKTIGV